MKSTCVQVLSVIKFLSIYEIENITCNKDNNFGKVNEDLRPP